MEQTGKLNGYKPRSYGDVIAIATLLTLFVSVVAWGLKLEGELNAVRDSYGQRIATLEAKVGNGILPRAEERIRFLEDRQQRCEQSLNDHKH